MRRSVFFVAFSIVACVGTPALAQVGLGGPTSDIWQNGTAPVPDFYVPRQTPNAPPAAAAGPVSNQPQNALPSWYPQSSGVPLNGGTLFTAITLGTYFDDNVFATNTNRFSDWAIFERPEFTWLKQGPGYTVRTDGFIEGREYDRFTSEDQINGSLGANFTVMPDSDTQVVGAARYIHSHLDRGASETVVPGSSQLLSTTFANPVAYDEGIESITLNKRYGSWWSSVGAAGLEIQYQNPMIGSIFGVNPFTGTTVDLSYADGAIGTAQARFGHVVAPLTSLFVETVVNTRDWQVSYFDSNGYRVDAGVLLEQGPGARLKGEAWFGYMDQSYNGVTMQHISSWTYGLSMSAVVTDNLTAVVAGSREAKEAALGLALLPSGDLGASAATCTIDAAVCVSTIESVIGGRLDYHISPRVVVGAGATYLQDAYQGPLAFGRVDSTFSPLASIKYFATPNVTLGFDYRNVQFSSSGGTAPLPFTPVNALPYNRNVYMLSLNARW